MDLYGCIPHWCNKWNCDRRQTKTLSESVHNKQHKWFMDDAHTKLVMAQIRCILRVKKTLNTYSNNVKFLLCKQRTRQQQRLIFWSVWVGVCVRAWFIWEIFIGQSGRQVRSSKLVLEIVTKLWVHSETNVHLQQIGAAWMCWSQWPVKQVAIHKFIQAEW